MSTIRHVAAGAQSREQSPNACGHEVLSQEVAWESGLKAGERLAWREGILGRGGHSVSAGQKAGCAWRENRAGPKTRAGGRISVVWPECHPVELC